LAGKHCERLGGQSRPQKIEKNDNRSFHFVLEIFDNLKLGHEEPTKNAQERGNDRKSRPNDTRDVKDFGIGLILVHAFEINEMLTKDGDSTTDTEDGDEDARPGKEEREERSQALFERRRDFLREDARGCERR
jgi:hypothetical protein